ncbi:MAG: SDR family NAD(P)-dependent oxidoreductase [Pseudomonadota bacterium]
MKSVLVTGNSSGLGLAMTHWHLDRGARVFGISRRGCSLQHASLHDTTADLGQLERIEPALAELLADVTHLDLVFLNAGTLGQIESMPNYSVGDLEAIMRVNVWSNKILLDALLKQNIMAEQIILVSSGASITGRAGWSGYALSKSTLNMLAQLYAHEFPHSHVCALAPGIFDSPMQGQIRDPQHVDVDRFASFQSLRDAKSSGQMPEAEQTADLIMTLLPVIRQAPSGQFQDIRNLD